MVDLGQTQLDNLVSWNSEWNKLSVVVLGLGVTGFSVADTLCELGADVTVFATAIDPDRARVLGVLGVHYQLVKDGEDWDVLFGFLPDLIIVSPGFSADHPALVSSAGLAIPVWGDIELAWRLRDRNPRSGEWILITGTNGKTTTSQLLEQMIITSGQRALACGNLGIPVLDAIRHPEGWDVIIVELSSFQLFRLPIRGVGALSPLASVCLNIAEDHLDWHGDFLQYRESKARVYENTSRFCVYNARDEMTIDMVRAAEVVEGARAVGFTLGVPAISELGIVDGILCDRAFLSERKDHAREITTIEKLAERELAAPHMVENILAAAALARACGVEAEAIRVALETFEVDNHRNQLVRVKDNIRWIDDSKATNTHAAAAALGAHESVVWIVGGLLKGGDVTALLEKYQSKLRAVVVIGVDQTQIVSALNASGVRVPFRVIEDSEKFSVMRQAVEAAREFAGDGDTVLLAPAAASMDQFLNYSDRGDCFQSAIRDMYGE